VKFDHSIKNKQSLFPGQNKNQNSKESHPSNLGKRNTGLSEKMPKKKKGMTKVV